MKVQESTPEETPVTPEDRVQFRITWVTEANVSQFKGPEAEDFQGYTTEDFAAWLQQTASRDNMAIEYLVGEWDLLQNDRVSFELDVEVFPVSQEKLV